MAECDPGALSVLLIPFDVVPSEYCLAEAGKDAAGFIIPRFVADAMAAFKITVSGGLIPQAKHGGSGVDVVAVEESKFEGTRFENVHIGQTQVALDLPPSVWRGDGLTAPENKADEGFGGGADSDLVATSGVRFCPGNLLERFGYTMILGDDLRKPA